MWTGPTSSPRHCEIRRHFFFLRGAGVQLGFSGFRVQGLEFRVWGLGFRVQGVGFGV